MDFISRPWNAAHQLGNQIVVLGDAYLSAVNSMLITYKPVNNYQMIVDFNH